MEPVGGGAYRAEIPGPATNGSSVAYYMEAQDDEGSRSRRAAPRSARS